MPNKPARLDDPFRGMKSGSWTKWGGARNGLIRSEASDTWCCQLCGEDQPMSLAGFFVMDELSGEHMKICAKCIRESQKVDFSYRKTLIKIKGVDKVLDEEIKELLTAWMIV